jgi:hypothetical protein
MQKTENLAEFADLCAPWKNGNDAENFVLHAL